MKVEKVVIQNYRNFKNFEITLDSFSLIIGENNVGKTNFLNALGLIFSPDITFHQKRLLEIDDINYNALVEFKNQIISESDFDKIIFPEIKVEVILSNFDSDQEAIVGDWFTGIWDDDISLNKAKITYIFSNSRKKELKEWFEKTRNSLEKVNAEHSIDLNNENLSLMDYIDFPIRHYSYNIFGGDDKSKRIDYYWLSFFKMEFLDALRDSKNQLLASGGRTLLYKVLNSKTENKIDEIKDNLLKLKLLIKSDDTLNEIKKDIEDFLKNISIENETGLVDFEFTSVEASELLKRISLIYGDNPINIERNGLGRNNLLYISLLLSQLTKKADDKKVYFRLIAIEEPESHLHPHLQETLSSNISFSEDKSLQIIATSHSTHIAAKLPLKNTIVLYKQNNNILPYYLLSNIPKESIVYLKKYLDATKSTMFFARRLILVEGISEQLLLPVFFSLYTGSTLEKYACSVINVNGVAFKHFLDTVNAGYFIKCAVITDSDSSKFGNASKRASDLKLKYESDLITVKITSNFLSTFEKELISANTDNTGKKILLKALKMTKPLSGEALCTEVGENSLDVNRFFSEIEVRNDDGKKTGDYKSEFAMNLAEFLILKPIIANKFNIPQYIKEAFDFIVN